MGTVIFAQTYLLWSYDPCFDYEIAAIIQEGIKDMYEDCNDNFYYITLMNENYAHPEKNRNASNKSILQGAYKFKESTSPKVRILASGVTLRFAIAASEQLENMNIQSEIWSITSFNELARGGLNEERNTLSNGKIIKSYVSECFSNEMPTIGVSEYMRSYPEQIRRWINGKYICLGTDGFGRSKN